MLCVETSTIALSLRFVPQVLSHSKSLVQYIFSGLVGTICACLFPYWKLENASQVLAVKNLSPQFNVGLWSRVSLV